MRTLVAMLAAAALALAAPALAHAVSVTVPADMTVAATSPAGATVAYEASAHDPSGNPLPVACRPPSGSTFPPGETRVGCYSRLPYGSNVHAYFTVTVTPYADTVPPTVSVPEGIRVVPETVFGARVTYEASASDAQGNALSPTCRPHSGSLFIIGDTVVICRAVDAAGNHGTASFTVTVVPHGTRPTVTVPADMAVAATSPAGAAVTYEASARDAAGNALSPACRPPSGSTFAVGDTEVTCTAVDAGALSASSSFTVTVHAYVDTEPPVVTVPEDMAATATPPAGAAVTYTAGATDNVDGELSPACLPASGSTFHVGQTRVVCAAADAAGNRALAAFAVTVAPPGPPPSPPAITVPEDMTVKATSAAGAVVAYGAGARDGAGGALSPACRPASGETFRVGERTVRCSAADSEGNSARASFTVTVTPYEPAPQAGERLFLETFASGLSRWTEAGGDNWRSGAHEGPRNPDGTPAAATASTVAKADDCDAGCTLELAAPVDLSGRTGATLALSRYVDRTLDAGEHLRVDVHSDGEWTTALEWTHGSGDDGLWHRETHDLAGHLASDFRVRLVAATSTAGEDVAVDNVEVWATGGAAPADAAAPAVTVPAGATAAATSAAGATVEYVASALDAVDGALEPTCRPASGSAFPVGSTRVTCAATDTARNTARAQFDVTVAPFSPPEQRGNRLLWEGFGAATAPWAESGSPGWALGAHEGPRNPDGTAVAGSGNDVARADRCATDCTLTMVWPVDLSGRTGATLALSRYVDRALDAGEYLKVEVHSDGAWTTALTWTHGSGDDGLWHHETHDLAGHLAPDFKVRLVARASSVGEDVAVDNLGVWATG